MNSEFETLLSALPAPPDYRWNWPALQSGPLKSLIFQLAKVDQNPQWHGEGNVWTHTRMVCEALTAHPLFHALPRRRQNILSVAALLHDVGKINCTKLQDGILASPGHASSGAQLARRLLWLDFNLCGSSEDQSFREAVCLLISRHTLPLHFLDRENPSQLVMRIAANGELCPDFSLEMLFLLAEADVQGRIADDLSELLDAVALNRDFAAETGCLDGPYPFPSAHTLHAYLDGRNVWPDQSLYNESWGEIILLCGLPGTGKDSWIQRHHPDLPTVSLDDIRRRMGVLPTDNQGTVIQTAREEARKFLRAKQPFIWNATSLTPSLRQNQLRLFEDYGASVRIVYLETPWAENLRRNSDRKYAVPEGVILHMLNKLSPPERFEARHVEWLCV